MNSPIDLPSLVKPADAHKLNAVIQPTLFDKLYLLFIIGLPFTFISSLVDPVLLPRQSYLTLFVLLTGVLIYFKTKGKPWNQAFSFLRLPVFSLAVLFMFVQVVATAQAHLLSESFYSLSKLGIEITFFILTTYLLVRNELHSHYIIKGIVGLLALVIVMAAVQFIQLSLEGGTFLTNIIQVNVTFGHKNLLSSLIFLCIPLAFLALPTKPMVRLCIIAMVIMGLLLIWLVQTKAVLVACSISSLVFLLLLIRYKLFTVSPKTIKTIGLVSLCFIGIIGVITYQKRQHFARIYDVNSSYERLSLWQNSVQMIKENLFLGVGPGNWQIQFPHYGLGKFATHEVRNGLTTFQRPHNDFLWVWCESGTIGLLLYLSLFAFILYYAFRLTTSSLKTHARWHSALFFAAIIGYLCIAFVDFPLERIEHQILLYLIFSMVIATYCNYHPTKPIYIGKSFLVVAFAISILFSGMVCYYRLVGEFHTQRLYAFKNRSNWQQMAQEADLSMNTFYNIDATSTPIAWYKGVALFSLGNTEMAKHCFESAYALHPYNIQNLNNLGSCAELLQDHQGAIAFYQQALTISAAFEEARLNLSAVYFNTGQYNQAFLTIDQCDVNTTDPKYKVFLPEILNAWLWLELKSPHEAKAMARLNTLLNDKPKLVQLYLEAKAKGVGFLGYLGEGN